MEAAATTERAGMTENGETSTEQLETGADSWTMVVDLVQSAFREGKMAEEAMWQAVVLIPKGKMEYRGIGLVEVMWKVVAAILNLQLMASITFHNFLHGFGQVAGQVPLTSIPICFSSSRHLGRRSCT